MATRILERASKQKQMALLIDPENYTPEKLTETIRIAEKASIDFYMIGGSLVSLSVDVQIAIIRKHSSKPVILFPGSLMQLSNTADGILFITLISGRNPEFLIGNHILAAPYIKNSGMEVIPAGYILIDERNQSTIEYVSNTRPIPQNKTELIKATAMAGELLGLKMIYLEAGSGAKYPVRPEVVSSVRQSISIPIIVGGGIRSPETAEALFNSGADILVIGNAIESDPKNILYIAEACNAFNNKVLLQ